MKKLLTILFIGIAINSYSQVLYVDVATTVAIESHASRIKSVQTQTNEELSKIQKAQALVTATMATANNYQQKILTGLQEVNSILGDAFVVKDIAKGINNVVTNTGEITKFATSNPEFAVFAVPAVRDFNNRLTQLSLESSRMLLGGEANMMNSGQRRMLLDHINVQVRILNGQSWQILYSMQSAKRVGFWNSLNPFKGWVNQDLKLMNDIIKRSTYL